MAIVGTLEPRAASRGDAQPAGAAPGLAYRPEIDGLRAIAVIAVLIFHAFPQLLPGGFAGVDVFFVISGYLITGIIDRQCADESFSFATFYARRILRIFPSLIPVVLATFLIAWFVFPVAEMEALGSNIKGAAAFIENFMLHEQIVGYFDPGAERLPLLHLWSLGIEEQYYIIWPAAFVLIARWPAQKMAIVAALGLGSLLLCLAIPAREAAWAFYSPTTRGWELLAGSLLAIWLRRGAARPIGPAAANLLAALGVAGLGFAFAGFSSSSPWPGLRTLVPVLAAMALIATRGTLAQRALAQPALVAVGLISYPLYLWHFPLIAFTKLQVGGPPPAWVLLAVLALSAVLAWLTYRFIERPIRFGTVPLGWRVGPLLAGMAALIPLGVAATSTHGLPIRSAPEIRGFMLSGTETTSHWRRGRCLLLLQPASEFGADCAGQGGRPLLLIWGDSYGAALTPGLLHFSKQRGYDVAQYTASACPPLIGYTLEARPFCKSINDDVVLRIGRLRPDVVILDATWGHAEAVLREDLPRTVAQLRANGIARIVLMGPPPSWQGAGLSRNVLDYYRETGTVLPERTLFRSNDEWTRGRDALFRELTRELGIDYISVRDVFCNDQGCLSRIGPGGAQLTAFDPGHLTVPGAIFLVDHTLDELLGPARQPSR
ncbi:acyltransferase [Bradyrhizobium sp. SSBR45G]|uniref:acyltransferase family protein n=1 Tax=unclassified Bradyrhizobium TaxID=2631580 RepID=UPI002342B239|nr:MULTISPECIES: acyltransferase family protein [unclassified Bradyrhizobium]GLH77352.1 acyltransferase [Bradyrhizobium sp. SSBR45G]GLH84542.1 acyltransferase [Bradyrhizobium sp. SSBR45R]